MTFPRYSFKGRQVLLTFVPFCQETITGSMENICRERIFFSTSLEINVFQRLTNTLYSEKWKVQYELHMYIIVDCNKLVAKLSALCLIFALVQINYAQWENWRAWQHGAILKKISLHKREKAGRATFSQGSNRWLNLNMRISLGTLSICGDFVACISFMASHSRK